MSYTPIATDASRPVGTDPAGSAAAEFRGLKAALNGYASVTNTLNSFVLSLGDRVTALEAGGGGGGGGDVTTAANMGGTSLVGPKVGTTLQFKGLQSGSGTIVTASTDRVTVQTVVISATDPGAVGPGVIWVQP
jgi:hypothetical protein